MGTPVPDEDMPTSIVPADDLPTAAAAPAAAPKAPDLSDPREKFKKATGTYPATQYALDEFMKNPVNQGDYQPSVAGVGSQLTGLPGAINQTVGGSVAGAAGFLWGAAPGVGAMIVDPANIGRHAEQTREGGRQGAASLTKGYNELTDSLSPWQTEKGKEFSDELASAPGKMIGEVSDSTLGKVLPDNAYQMVTDIGRDVGTVAPALGFPEMGRAGIRGIKDTAGTVKDFVAKEKASASGETPADTAAATDRTTPDVGSPVTGEQLRNQPNPIPPPEGTVAAAREEARGVPKAPQEAPEPTPAPSAGTVSPGDTQRGSVRIFNSPKEEGPRETPAPEEQTERKGQLDDLDKLSGGALPTRRSSALTGDYNATGDDWLMAKSGNETMQKQLGTENDAMHAAMDNVHKSTGSLQPDSVDPTTLENRGQIVRGAIQGIEDHFNKATDSIYDAARATSGHQPMPNFLGRASSFLSDDANYMPEGFRKAAQARLSQLKTSGDAGVKGDGSDAAAPSSVGAAEKFREWLNQNRTLDNMHTTRQLVNHTDMDVAEHGGPGLFRAARAQRTHQAQMLEEPAGIKKLLAPSDSQGVNHAIPEHKVMDYINGLDRGQHEHVMNVLRAGAHLSPELAESSAAAIREIQAHTVSRLHDAATNDGGKWNARDFYNASSQYARNAASTFKDRPDIVKNLKTVNDAGNTLHMDKNYPGATGSAVRSGALAGAAGVGGKFVASLAHDIPVVGRMAGRAIENATESATGEMGKRNAEKAASQKIVDRNGKQRGSVQVMRGDEERNPRTEYNANRQLAGGRSLSPEQNDIIRRLGGGEPTRVPLSQRGAVGDLSQRDAIQHEKDTRGEITHHRYSVPSDNSFGPGGQMHVTEYPGKDVSQVSTSRIVPSNRGQGWGTRMLQRAADDAHARGQVLHSDAQVSDGAAGAYKNLRALGYDVKMKDNDHTGGAYHAVGDHVFEVRPPKGKVNVPESQRGSVRVMNGKEEYEANPDLEKLVHDSAPPHRADPNGPTTWEDLKARKGEKVMPVNPTASENSIYKDQKTNIAFRAWHDKLHQDLDAGFDHAGELKVAQEHLRQAKAAGLSEESQRALWADTWETFKHHEDNGEFPSKPREFVAQQMKSKFPGDQSEDGKGSTLNVGLHQGNEGEPGFKKMSKQQAQAAVESTGAKVTKNTVLTPKQHGVSEPTSVMSTDRPISNDEMKGVLAKTKQTAIPQRTDMGDESMHVAQGHEARAKAEGWDTFNPEQFREHSGQTATDAMANPKNIHPDTTVRGPLRSAYPEIYDDPKEIMKRLGPGAPESPHLKEIFGKTREELHDDAIARGDVEPKTPTPGITQKGAGSAHAKQITTPENAERIRNIINAYKEHDPSGYHGMVGWYEMDPMYQSMKKILGGNEEAASRVYHRLNSHTAYSSPMSGVEPEIVRGTASATLANEGNFGKYREYGSNPTSKTAAKRAPELNPANFELGNKGHLAHDSQWPAISRFEETGQEANAVKTGTYRRSSDAPSRPGNDHQNTQPVIDSHNARGIGLADVRGAKAFDGSATGSEAKIVGPWFHDEVARHPDVNIPSTSAQAVQWAALSKITGVESKVGAPKLEIWADQIAKAAKQAGVEPKEMWERIVKRLAK